MKILRHFIFLLILSGCFKSYSQGNDELKKYYESKLDVITDSAIQYNKQTADTIYLSTDTSYREMIKDFYHFKDSIMLVYRDSLNIKRKDSVNFMSTRLKIDFDNYFNSLLDSMNIVFKSFSRNMKQQEELSRDCPDCKVKKDYNDKLDEYRDVMDSLCDNFEENFNSLSDTLISMAGDSVEGSMVALLDYTLDLVDDQTDENLATGTDPVMHRKQENEPSSELDIDVTYDSHDSYRGRDNGINEFSVAPSIQYQHKSGFGAFVDMKFLSKSSKNPDDYDAGISWQFDISNVFNIQLSYSHYWFNDSIQTRAALNNTIEGVFDLETKYYNTNMALDMDFGGGNREFSITWYHGLPLSLETKHLVIKPQMFIIVPVNVLDLSTKSAFGDFELEVTVPFSF
ncbi:MAG: hypothetical protein ACHQJ4_02030 [Ignavibacteria bacterium]